MRVRGLPRVRGNLRMRGNLKVYPRVVRGNRCPSDRCSDSNGSIPACCGGNPERTTEGPSDRWVYRRACGGNRLDRCPHYR